MRGSRERTLDDYDDKSPSCLNSVVGFGLGCHVVVSLALLQRLRTNDTGQLYPTHQP